MDRNPSQPEVVGRYGEDEKTLEKSMLNPNHTIPLSCRTRMPT